MIIYDQEEYYLTEDEWKNTRSIIDMFTRAFVTGSDQLDISDDAHWKQYLDILEINGVSNIINQLQRLYIDN